jgi:hypothetical protein
MRNNYADPEALATHLTGTASSADVTLTIAAKADEFWVIDWISWSYSADPTAGALSVTIGGTTVYQIDITTGGPAHIDFTEGPLYTKLRTSSGPRKNEAVVITLDNGAVVGKLNVRYR